MFSVLALVLAVKPLVAQTPEVDAVLNAAGGRHRRRERALQHRRHCPSAVRLSAVRSSAVRPSAVRLSAVLLFCFPALPASAQEPTLAAVLARAGAYVVEFQRQLSGVVAEERYVQDVRYLLGRFNTPLLTHRELKSDLLVVKPIGSDRWMQFRDVFEVDGKAVRDRDERLMQLFVSPSASSASQADRLVEESSRYNIGNLSRTVNVPVLALVILDPANQKRFRFTRADHGEPLLGRVAGTVADGLWIVGYQEVQKQTIIRTTNGRDLAAGGRFWIEPAIGLLVPIEMRERYDIRRDGSRVEGTATYGRFRQFQVKVDEKLAPIVKP